MSLVKKGTGGSSGGRGQVAPRGRQQASGNRFQYKARTAESVRERATRAVGGREGLFISEVQMFTPKKGENTLRFLPPPPEKADDWQHYGFAVFGHYDIGADKSAFACLNKMKGEPCALCDARDEASKDNEDDLAFALKPRERIAIWVIDRAEEKKGPQLWFPSATMDKNITNLCIDPKDNSVLAVDAPDGGYDFTFKRDGEGLKTKYSGERFDRRPSPLSDDPDLVDKWLQFCIENPLDAMVDYKSYEYLAKVYEGGGVVVRERDDKAKDDKPAAGRSKLRQRGEGSERQAEDEKPARAALKPRGSTAAPPKDEAGDEQDGDDLPSWEDMEAMDEDALAELGEAFEVDFGNKEFDTIDALREFVAKEIGVEVPAEEPAPAPAAAAGGWKAKLAAKLKK